MRLFLITILLTIFFRVSGQSVVINEVLARNVSTQLDETNNFSDCIELYNPGATSYTFNDIYLSDDPGNLLKYQIPAGTWLASKHFLVIWCDKQPRPMHANFRLDPDGETIYLSNSSMVILDSVQLDKQYINISYSRMPDGSVNRAFQYPANPGKTNTGATASQQADQVQFSTGGGFYAGSQTIRLSASSKATIYYTTDGSEPKETSFLYTCPISVSATKVIRARAFASGYLPGDAATQTYFINERFMNYPVFSISTDPKFFFDNLIGMYTIGTNGIGGMCAQFPVNYNQDWERPVNIEMYDPAKRQQINQPAGSKIYGNCSRRNAQKSLAFYNDQKYGSKNFTYQFFEGRNNMELRSLLLRNSGSDWNQSHLRDGYHHTLIEGLLDVDYLSYRPSVLYINGQYWGILNIREKHGSDYIWSNYGVDEDSVDVLQNNAVPDKGSNTHYNNMIDYIKSNDISLPVHYDYVCTQMDMDNFLDYFITQIFIVNTDWPGNNITFWRPQRPGGKWRWMMFDTDFGFGHSGRSASYDMMVFATKITGTGWPNPDWSTYLFRTLLKNDTFKHQFIDRSSVYLGSVFRSDRTVHILDSLASAIDPEMPFHMKRWSGNYDLWKSNIDYMRSFALARPTFAYLHMANYFSMGSPVLLELHSSLPGGSFVMNDIVVPDTVLKGCYFKNLLLKIKPLPPSGYKFHHWFVSYVNNTFDYFVNYGNTWRYLDEGSDQGTGWTTLSFNDAAWKSGEGEFGYGSFDEKTKLWPGSSFDQRTITNYFRKKINIPDTNNIKDVFIDLLYDDGAVIYINEQEVMRCNMPSGAINYKTLANSNLKNFYITQKIPCSCLKTGDNIIAVEIHQVSAAGEGVSFDMAMRYTISDPGPADTVITKEVWADTMRFGMKITAFYEEDTTTRKILINEICASNDSLKDEYGETDDWIELYNPTTDSMDAGGLFLTDSKSAPTLCRIPTGYPQLTTLAPKSYLRLWLDRQLWQGKLHLDLQLDRMGETLGLCQLKGSTAEWLDTIRFGYQDHLYTYGRFPDGDSSLYYMDRTPGLQNVKGYAYDTVLKNVVINELSAQNDTVTDETGATNDWIELYNPGTDTADIAGLLLTDTLGYFGTTRIPFGFSETKIAPKDYLVLWCDNNPEKGPLHIGIQLDRMGEQAGIAQVMKNKTAWIDTISFGYQDYLYSYGRYKDGDTLWMYMPMTPDSSNKQGYPADTAVKNILINEICAANNIFADEYGQYNDWMELYNPGADTVDIAGLLFTDRFSYFGVSRIPYGFSKTKIAPKDYLILWCDNHPEKGPLHIGIQLDKMGEQVGISQIMKDKTSWTDTLTYGFQDELYSYGRYKDGTPVWMYMPMTPDSSNKQGYLSDTAVKNVLINEICAANSTLQDEYGQTNDWIELYNPTDNAIDLAGMILTENPASPDGARIPYNFSGKTSIAPHDFLLLWCDTINNHGPLHLDIKIRKGGGLIAVTQTTGREIIINDSLCYPPQKTSYTYGRYRDGIDSMFFLLQTPGAANILPPDNLAELTVANCRVYPNPGSGIVNISTEPDDAVVSVYDARGTMIMSRQIHQDLKNLDMECLPSGMYVIHITSAGQDCVLTFIKQ